LRVTAWRRSTDVEYVVRVSVQDLSPPWHAWLGEREKLGEAGISRYPPVITVRGTGEPLGRSGVAAGAMARMGAMTEPVATSVPIVYRLRALEGVDRRAVNRVLDQQVMTEPSVA
jgi:hypothetical protein